MASKGITAVAVKQNESSILEAFKSGKLASMSKLVEMQIMPERPSALTPEEIAGVPYLWDLNTLKVEAFNHKQGGMMEGVRVEVINTETGERKEFMTASARIVSQVQEQIFPVLSEIGQYLPVTIMGYPHSSDPERTVWELS